MFCWQVEDVYNLRGIKDNDIMKASRIPSICKTMELGLTNASYRIQTTQGCHYETNLVTWENMNRFQG